MENWEIIIIFTTTIIGIIGAILIIKYIFKIGKNSLINIIDNNYEAEYETNEKQILKKLNTKLNILILITIIPYLIITFFIYKMNKEIKQINSWNEMFNNTTISQPYKK